MDDEIRKKRLKLFDSSRGGDNAPPSLPNHAAADTSEMYITGEVMDDTPEAQAVRAMLADLSCAECKQLVRSADAVLEHFNAVYNLGKYVHSKPHWHADVAVFVLLAGFDRTTKHNKVLKSTPPPQKPSLVGGASALANKMRAPTSLTSNGIGYGGSDAYGDLGDYEDAWSYTFAGAGRRLGHTIEQAAAAATQSLEHEDDRLAAGIMVALASLLDNPSAAKALSTLLLRSSILDRAANLLVNTSIDDITRRAPLYLELANFLRRLAERPNTAAVLHTPRAINKTGHDILRVAMGLPTLTPTDSQEKAQPLAQCMAGLSRQATMMVKNAQMLGDDSLATLCGAIQEAYDTVVKADTTSTLSLIPNAELAQDAVADVPDFAILRDYSLKNAANGMGGNVAKNRMKRITKEIIELSQNLPEGIHIRYGSGRPDIMKVLMVAPKGTPYENGLFEFDMLCPADYPQSPPQMQFKTTGGGTWYANPNLYADGKVCLSLLGTWQGTPWEPGKSSLYQVLVSIHAMILGTDDPWCNEPGREGTEGSEHSKTYNRSLHPKTVDFAMCSWLEGKGNEIWRDVVVKHFQEKQEEILQTIDKWKDDKPATQPRQKGKGKADNPPGSFDFYTPPFGQPFQGPGQTLGNGNDSAMPQDNNDDDEDMDEEDDEEMSTVPPSTPKYPSPSTASSQPKPKSKSKSKSKSKYSPKPYSSGKGFSSGGQKLGGSGLPFGAATLPSPYTPPPFPSANLSGFGANPSQSTYQPYQPYQPSPLAQSFLPPASAAPQLGPSMTSLFSPYQGTGWAGKKLGGEEEESKDEKSKEDEDEEDKDDDEVIILENGVLEQVVQQQAAQEQVVQHEVIAELADFNAKLRQAVKDLSSKACLGRYYGLGGDVDDLDL